jgi:hypothetical protein
MGLAPNNLFPAGLRTIKPLLSQPRKMKAKKLFRIEFGDRRDERCSPEMTLCPFPVKGRWLSIQLPERRFNYEPRKSDLRGSFLHPTGYLHQTQIVASRGSQGVHFSRISAGRAEKRGDVFSLNGYGSTECGESWNPTCTRE